MIQQIEVCELPQQIVSVLAAVAQGEEIVLTQAAQPVAKLIPYQPARRRRKAGSAAGQIVMSPDFDAPLEDFADYQC